MKKLPLQQFFFEFVTGENMPKIFRFPHISENLRFTFLEKSFKRKLVTLSIEIVEKRILAYQRKKHLQTNKKSTEKL